MRVKAAADPQRLLAPTASSAADAEQPPAAFKPLHSFSTADILRDHRFRVRTGSWHTFPERELLCGSGPTQRYACVQLAFACSVAGNTPCLSLVKHLHAASAATVWHFMKCTRADHLRMYVGMPCCPCMS